MLEGSSGRLVKVHAFFADDSMQFTCGARMTESKPQLIDIGRASAIARELHQCGRVLEAEQLCRQILQFERGNGEALRLLELIAAQLDRPEAFFDLANVMKEHGRLQDADLGYRKAIALKPDYVEAHNNRGTVLADLGWLEDAAASYRQALAIRPSHAAAYNNLGNVLRELGDHEEAERLYRRTLALRPDLAEACNHHANSLLDLGRLDEAERGYRRALELAPGLASAYSNLLLLLNFLPNRTPEAISAEAFEFGRQFGKAADADAHRNVADATRRLRIGYVSGDFRAHSVALFIEPVFAAHDREAFEIFCYYNFPRADARTARLRTHADNWRDVYALSDVALADWIRRDAIDILVDLSGHTAFNRLPVFAQKPAPVQVTWLGYPATTGLAAIDYRLTDGIADPEGESDRLHAERLIRLPHPMWCFAPDKTLPEPGPLPLRKDGAVTFGSFNYFPKLNPEVAALWAKLLARLPGSRLIATRIPGSESASRFRKYFEDAGIAASRVELHGIVSRETLAELFARVDIALDPFPYAGTTTTCEVLWMGIPVVTLSGKTTASRNGASLVTAVGLEALVAQSADQYLDVAEALARDVDRLAALREKLRGRMRSSRLADGARFTRDLENAFRDMWRTWCRGRAE